MQIINWGALLRVIRPSFVGTWVTFVISIVTVATLSLPALYQKLGFDIYFVALEEGKLENDIFGQYEYMSNTINSSELAADISTFVAWSVIGLIAFFIITNLAKFFKGLLNFFRLISYTFVNRTVIAEEAFIYLLVRGGTIGLAVGLYRLFMGLLLPFLIVMTGSIINAPLHLAVLYALISLFVVMLSIHSIIVTVRLLRIDPKALFNRGTIIR